MKASMKLTETDLRQHIAQRHSPLVTHNGGARIDTRLMLCTGAMSGPHYRTRPVTFTMRMRICRWVRGVWRQL